MILIQSFVKWFREIVLSKKQTQDDFFIFTLKELVELDLFLDQRFFSGDTSSVRGNKSLQVLVETLSNQMSYEFYSL
jgi:hypothetical protein